MFRGPGARLFDGSAFPARNAPVERADTEVKVERLPDEALDLAIGVGDLAPVLRRVDCLGDALRVIAENQRLSVAPGEIRAVAVPFEQILDRVGIRMRPGVAAVFRVLRQTGGVEADRDFKIGAGFFGGPEQRIQRGFCSGGPGPGIERKAVDAAADRAFDFEFGAGVGRKPGLVGNQVPVADGSAGGLPEGRAVMVEFQLAAVVGGRSGPGRIAAHVVGENLFWPFGCKAAECGAQGEKQTK